MIRYLNEKMTFSLDEESCLTDSLEFIEASLVKINVEKKLKIQVILTAEEVLVEMKKHAPSGSRVRIYVKRFLGDATVVISAPGEEIDALEFTSANQFSLEEMDDEDTDQAIRSILLKSMSEHLKYSFDKGRNNVRIAAGMVKKSLLVSTMIALLLGIVTGLLLDYVIPPVVSNVLCHYLFEPAKTIFMNAIKIIIAPVVFFSIVCCIAQFKDLSELGRIGIKVMGMYLLTTVIAIFLAWGVFTVLKPGSEGFALSLTDAVSTVSVDTNVDTSVLTTIINTVPSNFLAPLVESDTLQIIFLGLIVGIAVSSIGEYASQAQNFCEACNTLFLTITTIIAQFIPAVVFCCVLLMIVEMGGASFLSLLSLVGTYIVAVIAMNCVYGLLVLILAKLNPFVFFKNNREGMITSFTLSSSNAAMPTNIKVCTENMGIAPKVSSFSIPLGATVNMDGVCMQLVITGMFLARAYNVQVNTSNLFSLAITIMLLSLGCPGVPGAGLVCMAVVLERLGVPVEAIGLTIALTPFFDMFCTMSNTTGDVAATAIVAKSEKLLDEEIFYKK